MDVAHAGSGVALLIDWENLKASTNQSLKSLPDYLVLKKCARRFGNLRLARAFANWADPIHEGDMERLAQQDIDPIYVRTRPSSGQSAVKNSVDLRLACDGIELLATHDHLVTFLIVSGDGDMVHLMAKLKSHGRRTVVVAVKDALSPMLLDTADEVLLYDDLISGLKPGDLTPAVKAAIGSLSAATRALVEKGADSSLTAVKAEMRRQGPFEEEELGVPTFRHLAFLAELHGLVIIDSTKEPYRAYPPDKADDARPSGAFWKSLISALDADADYQKHDVAKLIKTIDPVCNLDKRFSGALKAGVIWSKRREFSRDGERRANYQHRLNVHHPRVQVARRVSRVEPKST